MPKKHPTAGKAVEDSEVSLKERINRETARAPWRELEVFYARGQAVFVSPQLDLVDVAQALASDNQERFRQWMDAGTVGEIPVQQASQWHQQDATVWAVVIAPWVLVQQAD